MNRVHKKRIKNRQKTEGILKFKLPEDVKAFKLAASALDWALVAWEMDQKMRSIIKYQEVSEETADKIQELRDALCEELEDNGLSFNMIE